MSINQIARVTPLAALLLVVVDANPEAEQMVAQESRAPLASSVSMATNAKSGELRCRIYFGCMPAAYDISRNTTRRGDQ